jgi:hypothetical protein
LLVHDKCAAFEKKIDELTETNQELRSRLLEALEVLGKIGFHQSTDDLVNDYENIKLLAYDATVKLSEF